MLSRRPESGTGTVAEVGTRLRDRVLPGAVCVLVIGVFGWSAHSGVLELLGGKPADSYYNLLVEGFRAGQLNLKTEVPAGLVRLADPYDPSANRPYRLIEGHPLWDTSYFHGKLYLYFGVTPALVLFWPYAVLTGNHLWHREAVVIFCAVGFLASAGLLWAMWRRCFAEVGVGAAAACMLALGLAAGLPIILQRCDVYEVAISCGHALVMLALAAIWRALHDSRRGSWWLATASLAYGLAVGARPSLLFGALILVVPVVQAWREQRPIWVLWLAAVGPILLIGLGLMLYNALRFDNPFVFGGRYQLSGLQQYRVQPFSPSYLWFNVRAYFLEPVRWSRRFPFVHNIGETLLPTGRAIVEHPFGVLTNTPLVWLALAVPLAWRNCPGECSGLRWFVVAVAMLFGICALTLGLFFAACARYQMEFVPLLMLLAVMGIGEVERALAGRRRWRCVARWGWGLLLACSVLFNLCASCELRREAPIGLGNTLLQMGKVDAAMAQFQKALTHQANPALAHFGLGYALFQTGRVDEAITHYQAALKIEPAFAKAHNNLGTVLRDKGRVDEAIAHLQKAVELQPDFAEAHNNLGTTLHRRGRLDEAIDHLQRALELQPDLALAHDNLGSALFRKGRVGEAIVHFQAALEIDSGDALAHNDLGLALREKGQMTEAIAHLQEAVRLQPDFVEAHDNLGSVLLQVGRNDEAIAHLQTALRSRPDVAVTHNNLGLAFCRKGRLDEAISQFQEALRLKPGDADASNNLAIALGMKQKSAGRPDNSSKP